MKSNLRGIGPPLLAGFLALGLSLSFLPRAFAESEEIEHGSNNGGAQENADGPLHTLQMALEKNSPKRVRRKVPTQQMESPQQTQDTTKRSMEVSPPMGDGMGSGGMMGMMAQMKGKMMPQSPDAQSSPPSDLPISSELPGFPGASHIYHIGATGFFIDHAEMTDLSTEQLTALRRIKEKWIITQAAFAQKIKGAEEELWSLTSLDRPLIKNIENKIREIQSLRGEKQITFIRYVGQATGVLTSEQRSTLLGTETTKEPASSVPANKPDSKGGMAPMGDM
ncbi:MAG: hypothetical protein K2X47_09915 [Bdellovibrionales bacterium]|nr:hypothetical protein [Bdellovibrionales bacterium]